MTEPTQLLGPLTCDVCGGEAVGVASSALGAVSFAYCRACLKAGAEPFGMVACTAAMCGGLDGTADWFREHTVPASLARADKTMAELEAEVASCIAEMDGPADSHEGSQK